MKNLLLIYLLVTLNISCGVNKKNQSTENNKLEQNTKTGNNEYNSSLAIWNKLKNKYDNSYQYSIVFFSYSGFKTTTTITVKEGVLLSRSYYEFNPANLPDLEDIDKPIYIENATNINSHSEGSPAFTIDELYKNCSSDFLNVDETQNYISFETDNLGLIKICGYTPKNCADDCFKGIRIAEFKWLE